MVEKAKAYLGNHDVPIEEEDHMFAVVSSGFMAYLRQTKEFAHADYVDIKPLVGPTRKMLRWAGVNWAQSARITGSGTASEKCYMFHRSALGYAINVGEDSVAIGYDEKQDTSWSRASVFHAAKLLQNTGIVQMKHDGSAFNLS